MRLINKIQHLFKRNKEFEDKVNDNLNEAYNSNKNDDEEDDIFDIDKILDKGPISTHVDDENIPRIERVDTDNPLLKDWYWKIYNDESGCLKSPIGKSYFSFDWITREYQKNEDSHYDYFYHYDDFGNRQTFKDFKKYAENYIIEHLKELTEIKKIDEEEEESL